MSQIKQVLLMHQQKMSNRMIARELGMSKNTVNRYVSQVEHDTYGISALVDMEDAALEHRFKAGNPAYTDPRFAELQNLLPYLEEEMHRHRYK